MQDKHNTKPLFTVFLEFAGTTSAVQVRATTADDAIKLWLEPLDGGEAYGLTKNQASQLLAAFDVEESAVPVQGLLNVWCKTIWAGEGQLALLHLIRMIDK
jgi:hypothetical protein